MSEIDERIIIRLRVLAAVALLLGGVLLVRLWFMQVVNGDVYVARAESNRVRQISVDAPRGLILDRHGVAMVKNRLSLNLRVQPMYTGNRRLINRLSDLLGMTPQDIRAQMRSSKLSPLEPRVVKRDLDMKTVSYVEEHQKELKGVEIQVTAAREYPFDALAAHVLGYTGEISDLELTARGKAGVKGYVMSDIVGKDGVEKTYEDVVRGSKGWENVEVNADNRPLRVLSRKNPVAGNDLVLTIDEGVQRSTEQALRDGMERARKQKYPNAKAGAAVVLDPNNGEIIAMASYPDYQPASFVGGISPEKWQNINAASSGFPLTNRAVMSGYPPGSTFKVVTASAGLATGIITPEWTFYDRGSWTGLGGRWLKWCWKKSGHGSENLLGALRDSCDSYFYQVSANLFYRGQEELQLWARNYGLGGPTKIDLPGEYGGRVPDKKWKAEFNRSWPENRAWFPGDTVNMGIGQGDILATPLQMANVYAAIANGGTIYQPRVVKTIVSTSKKSRYDLPPVVSGKLGLAPEQIAAIRNGLRQVTKTGTGAGAFAGFALDVPGKTGTSEVFGKDDYAFFVGFAPDDDPKYVVAVVIEQGGHGGSAAAPVVRQVLSDIYGLNSLSKGATDASR